MDVHGVHVSKQDVTSPPSYKGENFVTSCLTAFPQILFQKGIYSNGSKLTSLIIDLFSEESKNNIDELSPLTA